MFTFRCFIIAQALPTDILSKDYEKYLSDDYNVCNHYVGDNSDILKIVLKVTKSQMADKTHFRIGKKQYIFIQKSIKNFAKYFFIQK